MISLTLAIMQKKIIALSLGLVAVAGTAAAGLTWYNGHRIASALEQQATALAPYPMIKLVERQYQSGFMSASETATYRIGCDTPQEGEPRDGLNYITLKQEISHLPFATRIETSPVLPAEFREGYQKWLGSTDHLRVVTELGLGGKFSSRFQLPAHKHSEHGENFDFGGLDLQVSSDKELQAVEMKLSLASLLVSKDERFSVALGKIDSHSSHQRSAEGLYVGQDKSSLSQLAIQFSGMDGSKQHIRLEDLSSESQSQVIKGLLESRNKMQIGKLINASQDLGQLNAELGLQGLDAALLAKLNHGSIKSMLQCQPAKPDEEMQQMLQLLKGKPQLTGKLSIAQGDKAMQADLKLSSEGISEQDLAMGIAAALPKLSATLDTSLNRQLLENWVRSSGSKPEQDSTLALINSTLDGMISQGYLHAADNKVVKAAFAFKQGALTLNGKPFDPNAMRPAAELPEAALVEEAPLQ